MSPDHVYSVRQQTQSMGVRLCVWGPMYRCCGFCNVLKETHDVMKLCEDFPVTVVFKSPVFKIFLNKKIPKRVAQTLGAYSEMLPCVCEREGAILKVSVSFVFNGHLLPSCQARTKCAHTNETAVCFKMPLLCHLKPRLPSHHDPVLKCSRLA